MNEQQEKKIEYNPDFWNIGGKKSRKNTGKKKTKEENSDNLPNDNLSNDDLPNDNFINQLKNRFSVSIDEVEIIKEDVVFKIPKKLN